MKTWFSKAGYMTVIAFCVAGALLSVPPAVLADDTEVFFPPAPVSGVGSINPNILFVLDDSTSMNTVDTGQVESRFKRIQNAFVRIMDQMNAATNVGLMRFSYKKGGPVVFPVAPVESLIANVHSSFATINQGSQIVAASASEAEEIATGQTGAGNVTINQVPIYLGARGVVERVVDQEAEQTNSSGSNKTRCNSITVSSTTYSCNSTISAPLDLIKTTGTNTTTNSHQWVGLRFHALPLPTDFVATDARLVFVADEVDADPVDLKIYGNRNNQALPFRGTPNFNVASSDSGGTTSFAAVGPVTTSAPPCTTLTTCTQSLQASGGGRVPTNGSPAWSYAAPYSYSGATSGTSGSIPWTNAPAVDDSEYFVSPNVKDIVNEIKNCAAATVTATIVGGTGTNSTGASRTFTFGATVPAGLTLPGSGSMNITFLTPGLDGGLKSATITGTNTIVMAVSTLSTHAAGQQVTFVDPSAVNSCSTSWVASPTTAQNVMTFMIGGDNSSGKGRRRMYSLASDTTKAAKLQVAYTSASAPATKVITGLRFANIQIPKGVTVTNAQLKFNQDALGGYGNLRLKVSVQTIDDAPVFAATANNISGRTWSTPVTWDVPAWSNPIGTQTSIDIKSLLNSNIINRSGWCGANAIAFKLEIDTTGTDAGAFRRAISSGMNDNFAPSLIYSYSSSDTALETGCTGGYGTTVQVATGMDDIVERISNGAVTTGGSTLDLGCPSTCNTQIVGLRFPNISLPQGAVVTNAYLDFGSNANASSGTASFTIYGQNSDDAPVLVSTAGNLKSRRDTNAVAATVVWNSGSGLTDWTANKTYTSPDIKTIIQQIVNRPGWTNGSAVVLMLDGSGRRQAFSYEGKASAAPKLRISYRTTLGKMTVRNYIKLLVNQMTPRSNTPSVGTLYEAARYMRGEAAFYGRTRGFGDTLPGTPDATTLGVAPDLSVSHPSTFTGSEASTGHVYPTGCTTANLSDTACAEERYTGTTTYKTPIIDSCQQSNIVFLTDGYPNNNDAMDKVKALKGNNTCKTVTLDTSQTMFVDGGTCAEELSEYLYTTDQIPTLNGAQKIRTFTIGFSFPAAAQWLTDIATKGGGEYFEATSADDLVTAFQAIIASILDVDTTFVAPAVTVNTFNRLTNRNELYFALFKPDLTVNWPGNVKRYKLVQASGSSSPDVYGKDNNLAVDASTGFFKDSACSFWSTCPDGSDVALGGTANRLDVNRKIYTYIGSSPSNVDLTATASAVTEGNTAITKAILNIPSATDPERESLLKWVRGLDVNDDNNNGNFADARLVIGDPLHSEPALVSYGGTDASPDMAIYYGDNHGYLHGANASGDDATGGKEYFSFIPQELLGNLNTYYDGGGSYKNRPYGMDGPVTPLTKDANQDNVLSGAGEFAYIYAAMRRGGRNYYALDVTSRTAPKLKFQIKGGTTGSLGDYRELGQTWSSPVFASIRYNNTDYGVGSTAPVMIFTGGYDPAQDSKADLFSGATPNGDAQGRAIFVANAYTGELLWWAGYKDTGVGTNPNLSIPDMVYSVPAAPQPVDMDGDGMVDRIYIADAGGQVFRIILGPDSSNKPSLSNAAAMRLAKLSAPGAATSRHFFNRPDVAIITQRVGSPFVAIAIGTGHRERPLDTATGDRFYVLKDPDLTNDTPLTATLINGDSDLYNATSNLAGSSDTAVADQARADIAAKKGLYINLGGGEKSLTRSTTVNGVVLFATFKPGASAAATSCQATQGESRFYQINIADGTPIADLDGSGSTTLTANDRSKIIPVAGLPPDPVVLFPSIRVKINADGTKTVINDGSGSEGQLVNPIVMIGAVRFDLNGGDPLKKSYWRQN